MLREVYCDQFVCNGKIREPIVFHDGLNTILGSESGTNSIGKSTFLMILDFGFGGMDYVDKSENVQKNIGAHTVCYTFEFDGERYHFSRSTARAQEVNICDDQYHVIETITRERYCEFLRTRYGLDGLGLSFRAAIGKFFRVDLRECCDTEHPLKSANRAPDKEGIIELLKLFNKYTAIHALVESMHDAEERHKAYKKAIGFSQITAPAGKKEYKNNKEEIAQLEEELAELLATSNVGLLDLDVVKTKILTDIKKKHSELCKQKHRLQNQKILLRNGDITAPTKRDFSQLLRYFPNADTRQLADVEHFHKGVTTAIHGAFSKRASDLDDLIALCNKEMTDLEAKAKSIVDTTEVPRFVLDHYAELKQKRDSLAAANDHYDEEKAMAQSVTDMRLQLSDLLAAELCGIEDVINERLVLLNGQLYDTARPSPILNITDEKHYSFETPNDNGTGTRDKGLILFDLSLLQTTALPVIAHDSILLKQIEDDVLEQLLELYASSSKQVFIAMDKPSSYTKRTEQLLNETAVLRLSRGGNELFGRSWNKLDMG